MRRLILKVREASRGEMPAEWLIPLMTRRNLVKGDVLFRMGDPGELHAPDPRRVDRDRGDRGRPGPRRLRREMGVFGPDNRRTGTAVCETEVEIGSISDKQAMLLYYQNPAFGFHLFRLVVQRVLENEQRWRAGPYAPEVLATVMTSSPAPL
jgi:hypothetical protein